MIVRILNEGQFTVPDDDVDALNAQDERVVAAIEVEDDSAFRAALHELLTLVRDHGTPVPVEKIVESDVILPAADFTLAEAQALLGDEGLIPG